MNKNIFYLSAVKRCSLFFLTRSLLSIILCHWIINDFYDLIKSIFVFIIRHKFDDWFDTRSFWWNLIKCKNLKYNKFITSDNLSSYYCKTPITDVFEIYSGRSKTIDTERVWSEIWSTREIANGLTFGPR